MRGPISEASLWRDPGDGDFGGRTPAIDAICSAFGCRAARHRIAADPGASPQTIFPDRAAAQCRRARDWNDPSTAIYARSRVRDLRPALRRSTAAARPDWCASGPAASGPRGRCRFGDQQRLIFSDIPNDRLMAHQRRDRPTRMSSANRPTSSTATPATARAAWSRANRARAGSPAPSMTGQITVAGRQVQWQSLQLAERRDRQVRRHGLVSPTRATASAATTKATALRRSCRAMFTGSIRRAEKWMSSSATSACRTGFASRPTRTKFYVRLRHWPKLGGPFKQTDHPRVRRGRGRQALQWTALARLQGRAAALHSPTTSAQMRTRNIWAAGGWSPNHAMNGVRVFAPDGTPAWRDRGCRKCAANLCFGGHHHNRLFICASTSRLCRWTSARAAWSCKASCLRLDRSRGLQLKLALKSLRLRASVSRSRSERRY